MKIQPLNARECFEVWPSFSPGEWLDFNPTVITTTGGHLLAFIRRDKVPPVPGEGSIWSVPVDASLRPIGIPHIVVKRGEDPRAVVLGGRIFLFYIVIEKDAEQRVLGSCVMLAELTLSTPTPSVVVTHKLPKNPTGNLDLKDLKWEKNWVPFVVDRDHIGLIYAHNPWTVMLLNVAAADTPPKFVTAFLNRPLAWTYGEIRGGTVPIIYDDNKLITFFHSSQVIGSRNVYMVGACIFENAPPFTPIAMTSEPLLFAPYRFTASRFGWNVLASVIFPLGAIRVSNEFRLLCGLDDGEIGVYRILLNDLNIRLTPVTAQESMTVVSNNCKSLKLSNGPVIFTNDPDNIENELPLARFLSMLPKLGGTYLDFGAVDGLYLVYLSNHFSHVVAVGETHSPCLQRNLAVNFIKNYKSLPTNISNSGKLEFILNVTFVRINLRNALEVLSEIKEILTEFKPMVLIVLQDSKQNIELIKELMRDYGYSVEHYFPLTPQVIMCTMPNHRKSCNWLL